LSYAFRRLSVRDFFAAKFGAVASRSKSSGKNDQSHDALGLKTLPSEIAPEDFGRRFRRFRKRGNDGIKKRFSRPHARKPCQSEHKASGEALRGVCGQRGQKSREPAVK
jgi:hypothetical protein